MTTGLKEVDLDNIIDEFNIWQKFASSTQYENAQLQTQVESLQKLMIEAHEREKSLMDDVEQLKQLVDQLQDTLAKRCDLEDANRKLKGQLEVMQSQVEQKDREFAAKMMEKDKQLKEMGKAHNAAMVNKENELKAKGAASCIALQHTIDEKNHQIQYLQRQMAEMDQENQAELTKIRMEYDSKLLKLQKQSSRQQQAGGSATANQDIFRKKLQNVRAESEREITSLKHTIMELQKKQAAFSGQKTTTNTRGLGLVNKRKLF